MSHAVIIVRFHIGLIRKSQVALLSRSGTELVIRFCVGMGSRCGTGMVT